MRSLFRLAALAILAGVAWAAWAVYWPVVPSGAVSVMLRPGWTSRRIAVELQRAGVITNSTGFLLVHYAQLRPLKAGEYRFERPANARQVYDRVAQGDVYFHPVVVPEGFTMFDVASAMQAAGLGTREDFLRQAQADVKLVSDLDPEAQSLEGYLFPDTYHFTRTQSMHDMIAVMVHRFRQEAKAIGLDHDLHRLVTLASIVEKETSSGD